MYIETGAPPRIFFFEGTYDEYQNLYTKFKISLSKSMPQKYCIAGLRNHHYQSTVFSYRINKM